MIPKIKYWEGISCDLSVTSIQEGIRQFKETFKENPFMIFMKEESYNTIKDYVHQMIDTPLSYHHLEILHKECFILTGDNKIFFSSNPI